MPDPLSILLKAEPMHPHNLERGLFIDLEVDGKVQRQPAPAPRLSRTPAREPVAGARCGEHTDALLAEIGLSPERIQRMRGEGNCA